MENGSVKKNIRYLRCFYYFFTILSTNQLAGGWCNNAHLKPLILGSSSRVVNCGYMLVSHIQCNITNTNNV